MVRQSLVGLDLLDKFLDHTETHHNKAEFFWTSYRPVAETCYLTIYATLIRDECACPRRYSNPQSQQASGRRPTP